MTIETAVTTETILSDDEVATLNKARTILDSFARRCGKASWDAPVLTAGAANPADYGRVEAIADVAENGIFKVLNWANSHRVRTLTEEQLHNRISDELQAEAAA